MSRSYHTTYTELKGTTKIETEEMLDDPNSILHELAEKSRTKKNVKKQRKLEKLKKKTGYNKAYAIMLPYEKRDLDCEWS